MWVPSNWFDLFLQSIWDVLKFGTKRNLSFCAGNYPCGRILCWLLLTNCTPDVSRPSWEAWTHPPQLCAMYVSDHPLLGHPGIMDPLHDIESIGVVALLDMWPIHRQFSLLINTSMSVWFIHQWSSSFRFVSSQTEEGNFFRVKINRWQKKRIATSDMLCILATKRQNYSKASLTVLDYLTGYVTVTCDGSIY